MFFLELFLSIRTNPHPNSQNLAAVYRSSIQKKTFAYQEVSKFTPLNKEMVNFCFISSHVVVVDYKAAKKEVTIVFSDHRKKNCHFPFTIRRNFILSEEIIRSLYMCFWVLWQDCKKLTRRRSSYLPLYRPLGGNACFLSEKKLQFITLVEYRMYEQIAFTTLYFILYPINRFIFLKFDWI